MAKLEQQRNVPFDWYTDGNADKLYGAFGADKLKKGDRVITANTIAELESAILFRKQPEVITEILPLGENPHRFVTNSGSYHFAYLCD